MIYLLMKELFDLKNEIKIVFDIEIIFFVDNYFIIY